MPVSVPLCGLPESVGDDDDVGLSSASAPKSELSGLRLRLEERRSRWDVGVGAKPFGVVGEGGWSWPGCESESLNMWMVSVPEETQSSVEVPLKAMLKMRAGMEPRRNWASLRPSGTEKTRIMVPLSDAVARCVPLLSMAM